MVVALFAGVVLVAGPIGGLVTGVRSDYYVLVGEAREPTRNLANPFRTNVEPRR